MNKRDFGPHFAWGVATSAYQTEGAYLTDGKGLSIWDTFTAQPGKIQRNQSGNIACDFYNRYIHDLILMQYLGIPNFRFSISWSRIFPDGTGWINDKGVDFYNRLIDFCLELGIEPWITLYHWDLPQALENKGGWTSREVLNWFLNYTETCVRCFGDRVKNWMVLNEPLVFTGAGYFLGLHAPGKKGLSNFLPAVHHASLCQAEGGRLIKSNCSNMQVGTTFSVAHLDPHENSRVHTEAVLRMDALLNRLFVEPLLGFGYPVQDLRVLQQLEKYMRDGDERRMQFDMDFIGIQNYTREVVRYSPFVPFLNARIIKASQRNVPRTTMNWEIYPESMYQVLKKFYRYQGIKKLLVTENGAAFPDVVEGGTVYDYERIRYLEECLAQVLRAKEEGVPVDGYFVWTFTDNFEWAEGFQQRFGLVYTDFATQKRIIKASGHWFQRFLNSAALANTTMRKAAG